MGKEGLNPVENAVKKYSVAEMIVGAGLALIPGLGAIGATAFIFGLAKFEYLRGKQVAAKNKGA